jgi:cell division protease FtsH
MINFEEAKDKVMLGVERKSMVITDRDRKITAYHESGHALVAYFTENADPVHKVTIVPRGQALGVTAQLPVEDKYNYSKKYLLGRLDILMGGRCAENIIFKDSTTGAGNDIAVATDIAKKMVCEWGMSETIGPLKIGRANEEVFLGKDYNENRNTSDHVSELIDNEISKLIKNAESNATNIINSNIDKLHDLTNALLDLDTIDSEEFVDILKNGYNPENEDLESSETNTDSQKQSRRTSKTVIKES